jgi:hypothetical protein
MFLLEVAGWWILLSCVLGPCATWLFFYGERRAREAALLRMQPRLIEYRPAPLLCFRRLPQLVYVRRAGRLNRSTSRR